MRVAFGTSDRVKMRVLLLGCAWLGALSASAKDSPFFRGPNRNGTHLDADIRVDWQTRAPKALWRGDVDYGFSQVVVADGKAVTAGGPLSGGKGLLYCFDAETGKELWKTEFADTSGGQRGAMCGPVATPALDQGRVYMVAAMGALHCFDLDSGEEIWKQITNSDEAQARYGDYGDGVSPVVEGNLVIAHLTTSPDSAAWQAFSKADGKPVWSRPITKPVAKRKGKETDRAFSCAVVHELNGKPHAILVSNGSIDGVELETGKPLFTHSIADLRLDWGPFPEPAFFDENRFLLGCWYAAKANAIVFEIQDDGLKRLWSNRTIGRGAYSYVIRDGFAYGYGSKGLQCVDLSTAKVKWKWRSRDKKLRRDQGEIISIGDKLLWLSTSGMLYVGNAAPNADGAIANYKVFGSCPRDTRKERTRYNGIVCTSPTFADGRLYCRAPWGEIVCIDMK